MRSNRIMHSTCDMRSKGKVKFTLKHATKAQRGSGGIALLFP